MHPGFKRNTMQNSAQKEAIIKVSHRKTEDFLIRVFSAVGFKRKAAKEAAGVMIQADLRGIDSHGIARLPGYIRQIGEGKIKVDATPEIVHETPSTALMDAKSSLGMLAARKAMRYAIEKSSKAGSGWVGIQNSTHFGIAAAHARLALQKDMAGVVMTNASPLVAPRGSSEALLGTNPVCFAFPAGEEKPFIGDMATSVVANGKLEMASRNGDQIPGGWVQDKTGRLSGDPGILKSGGTLLPLGSEFERSSHKGYVLGSIVDILSGVLTGANFGPWVPPFVTFLKDSANPVGKGIGHFVGAWRIDAFRPAAEFKKDMDRWIRRFKQARTTGNVDEVLIPGEPENREEEKRKKHGIPLNEKVYQEVLRVSKKFEIDPGF